MAISLVVRKRGNAPKRGERGCVAHCSRSAPSTRACECKRSPRLLASTWSLLVKFARNDMRKEHKFEHSYLKAIANECKFVYFRLLTPSMAPTYAINLFHLCSITYLGGYFRRSRILGSCALKCLSSATAASKFHQLSGPAERDENVGFVVLADGYAMASMSVIQHWQKLNRRYYHLHQAPPTMQ